MDGRKRWREVEGDGGGGKVEDQGIQASPEQLYQHQVEGPRKGCTQVSPWLGHQTQRTSQKLGEAYHGEMASNYKGFGLAYETSWHC